MDHWVNVRLGVALPSLDTGIPKDITFSVLDTSLIESQPSVLMLYSGGSELEPHERDCRRASRLRERLSEKA